MDIDSVESMGKTGIVLLSPCFNDWESIQALIPFIDKALKDLQKNGTWVLVNDGSIKKHGSFDLSGCENLEKIEIIHLHTNIGAQKAIAVGLCYISDTLNPECIVLLDSDGEDRPKDIPDLISTCIGSKEPHIIFAERQMRSEGLIFSFFYCLYRILHRILTGRGIKVGNFSAIHPLWLDAIVNDSDLWNHYAASVYKSKIPVKTIPTKRGKRIMGTSQMNFTSLVLHGLSAIFCYAEIIGIRLLVGVGVASLIWFICGILLLFAAIWGLGTANTTNFISGSLIIGWFFLLQILFMGMGFIGLILHGRKTHVQIPIAQFKQYIRKKEQLSK